MNKDPIACPVCASIFIPAPGVIISPKGYKGRPVYKLEKPPDPKAEKIEPTDQNSAEADVASDTDEQVLDPADVATLLDNDDDPAAVVVTEVSKDEQSSSDNL